MTSKYRVALWVALWIALAASWIRPPFAEQMMLQHIPTVLALAFAPWLFRRFHLSDEAISCFFAFLLLHIVAARYIYSYVPYDTWASELFGTDITSTFGFGRNHFDRLVHFSFGLLFVRPVWEICATHFGVPRRFAYYVAFEFVLAFSMLYELVEWGLSLVLAAEDANSYNGQQGDIWDAQKDMGFAAVGAIISLAVLFATRHRRMGIGQP